jgi:hypothetical protein
VAKRVFSIGNRIHIRYSDEQMTISINERVRLGWLVVLAFMALAWSCASIGLVLQIIDGTEPFGSLLIVLVIVAFMWRSLLRTLWNEELITVSATSITLDSQPRYLRFFQPPSRYSAARITKFSIAPEAFAGASPHNLSRWQWSRGAIEFVYFERGGGPARFGSELEPAEARQLINLIVEHYPIYGMETALRNTNASQ